MDVRKHKNKAGRISVRFRRISILLFALVFCLTAALMTAAFNGVIGSISLGYARHYAISSAEALSAHITKEIGLMAKAAGSGAVADWLADEGDAEKQRLAHEELSGIVNQLYSYNLYVGFEGSRNEYQIGPNLAVNKLESALDRGNPNDVWYFDCIASDSDYILSVNIDHELRRKRVWLDYKIVRDGVPLGVICTGLEFSHIAGELFSQYDSAAMRGLILDENGVIYIDSSLLDDEAFLTGIFEAHIETEFSDPGLLDAIHGHLSDSGSSFRETGEPVVVKLPSGPHRYMTIAPIRNTGWAAVFLFDPGSMFSLRMFLPAAAIMLVLLAGFAVAANTISFRLIFRPLNQLNRSLEHLREDSQEQIYGVGRDDELGNIANTIQDLFTKSYYDALTGIRNRRYMESNLQHYMEVLSRSNGCLSVLMLDVDFFKKYNDAYGHEQGDVCLRTVAQALAGSMSRSSDFAARYGGEEFVAVLPNTDEAGARQIAEKALENIRNLQIPHKDSAVAPFVTVSVGVTTGKAAHMQSWEDYIGRADEALYASKQSGRNRVTVLTFEG